MDDQSGNTVIAIVAGLVTGVAIGVLLAPEKGTITRRRLSDSADGMLHTIEEGAEAISEFSHRFSPFTHHVAHGAGYDKFRQNIDR